MNRLLDLQTQVDQLVLTQLPSAFPEAIDKDVQETIRDFYVKTACWRAALGPFGRRAGVAHVHLSSPPGTAINLVHEVTADSFPLGARIGSGHGWVWAVDRPELLTVFPVSDQDELKRYIVTCSLLPVSLDAVVPEAAVTHHLGTIVAGCLSRLYGQATKPWYSQTESRNQQREWLRGMAAAKAIGYRGYAPATLVAYNPFGRFA